MHRVWRVYSFQTDCIARALHSLVTCSKSVLGINWKFRLIRAAYWHGFQIWCHVECSTDVIAHTYLHSKSLSFFLPVFYSVPYTVLLFFWSAHLAASFLPFTSIAHSFLPFIEDRIDSVCRRAYRIYIFFWFYWKSNSSKRYDLPLRRIHISIFWTCFFCCLCTTCRLLLYSLCSFTNIIRVLICMFCLKCRYAECQLCLGSNKST